MAVPRTKRSDMLHSQEVEDHHWRLHSLQHPATRQQRRHFENEAAATRTRMGLAATTPATTKKQAKAVHKPQLHTAANPTGNFAIPGEVSFTIVGNNVGVLRINNFEPADNAPFIQLIQQAVTNHQLHMNGTQLIIDLRSNGGGDICLGYAVLRFLFPAISQPSFSFDAATSPFGRYDTVVAPVTQWLADLGAADFRANPLNNSCAFFTPCGWLNPATQLPYTDETWFDSGRVLDRGGVEAQYTNLFHGDCTSYFSSLAPAAINPGYAPANVAMVSDGMCGSTCSVFSSFIQFHGLAKSVALGGVHANGVNRIPPASVPIMQFWSFPGGQVTNIDEMAQTAAAYGIAPTDPRIPQPLPNGAAQSWALREIYPVSTTAHITFEAESKNKRRKNNRMPLVLMLLCFLFALCDVQWNDTVGLYPLEFLHVPSDFHFAFLTDAWNEPVIYANLLGAHAIFSASSCVAGLSGATLACAMPHGLGAYSCVGGVVGTHCLATMCSAGYAIVTNASSTTCQACAPGTYRAGSVDPSQQAVCSPCPQVYALDIPQDDDVQCAATWTAPAWPNSNCPYTLSCSSARADHRGQIQPVLMYALFAAAAAIILILIVALIVQTKKTRSTAPLDDDMHYARVQN